jgi:hypothetical protein
LTVFVGLVNRQEPSRRAGFIRHRSNVISSAERPAAGNLTSTPDEGGASSARDAGVDQPPDAWSGCDDQPCAVPLPVMNQPPLCLVLALAPTPHQSLLRAALCETRPYDLARCNDEEMPTSSMNGATLRKVVKQEAQGSLAISERRFPQILAIEVRQIKDIVRKPLALAFQLLLQG